jgi:hypothetical protein
MKQLEIRNSTMEFLTFVLDEKEEGVQIVYKNQNIWATQKVMATLFDVGVPAISKHLKNIFESGELNKDTTISKMETIVNGFVFCGYEGAFFIFFYFSNCFKI